MPERVLLHVGLQKSGTTFLQRGLAAASGVLEERGVRYPVNLAGGYPEPNHQHAVYGLLPAEFPWVTGSRLTSAAEQWAWLRARLAESDEPVLLSAEVLSFLGGAAVRAVVEALDSPDLRVLITARRLDRLLISSWQQNLRNGNTYGLDEFLRARANNRASYLKDIDDSATWQTWRAFDAASSARPWADALGPERVTLVTSPGRPRDLLWHRFIEALELPGDGDLPVPDVPVEDANEGLRWAEAEVLAGVNAALADDGTSEVFARRVRRTVVREGFATASERGVHTTLPGTWPEVVAGWSSDELERLSELSDKGMRVVGDLDDLVVPAADAVPGPDAPSFAELRAAAGTAVAATARASRPDPVAWTRLTARAVTRRVRRLEGRLRPGGD